MTLKLTEKLIKKYGEEDFSAYGYEKMKRLYETEMTQGTKVKKIEKELYSARRQFKTTLLINITKDENFNKDNFFELLRWEEFPTEHMITLNETNSTLTILITNLY